jgi:hypothetical protein
MELKCPKCGIRMHSLECFSDSCNWKPSITDQLAWHKEQRERFERRLNHEDYTMEIVHDES